MANDISTSFNDRQMFVTQPDWGKDITSQIAVERRVLQYIGGVKIISQVNTDTPITASGDFTLFDRESVYNLLEFFNARKGGTKSFWFLHPARFFTLKENYSSGSGYLEVERNYCDLWTQALPSQYDWGIYIYMHNGDLICRKVTGITDETDRSYIYLDETIPRNITADNHFIIGRTLVGRFDQNQLSIDFSTQGIGITPLKLKENYRVYDSWTPIDGIHLWDLAHPNDASKCGMVRALGMVSPWPGGAVISTWDSYMFNGTYAAVYYNNPYVYFHNVIIPQGATVKNATVTFLCAGDSSNYRGFDLDVCFANYDTAPDVGGGGQIFRFNVTSYVKWHVNHNVIWIAGDRYTTPDLSASLQTVIDRPGWASNKHLLLCCFQHVDMGWYTKYWSRPDTPPTHPRLRVEFL